MGFSSAFATPLDVEINGKQYKVSPLKLGDFGKQEAYMKSKLLSIAFKQASDIPDRDVKTIIIERALQQANAINIFAGGENNLLFDSLDAVFHLVYLSLVKCHPEITVDSVQELLSNDVDIELLNKMVMYLSGFHAEEDESKKKEEVAKESHSTSTS
jgi:hypothetical protein